MATGIGQDFYALDSEANREALAAEVRQVRQAVMKIAERVPEAEHFEQRYHGWSLAAMLTHLNTIDQMILVTIRLALIGIRPPLPMRVVNLMNDTSVRFFQRRDVASALQRMRSNEPRILDLILTLPQDHFARKVYYPPVNGYITVEQSLTQFFVRHWEEHLQTLQGGEGIWYEPPASGIKM